MVLPKIDPHDVYLNAFSKLGDGAVMLLLVMAIGVWLFTVDRANFRLWVGASSGCIAAVLILKLMHYLDLGVLNVSGHGAIAAFALCGGAQYAPYVVDDRFVKPIWGVAVVLILSIGLSRVLIEAHTPAEALAGLFIGGVGVGVQFLRSPVRRKTAIPLAAWIVIAAMPLTYGHQLSAENALAALAREIAH
jgi:membrane-associated phospholipid phosphatase